MGYKAEGGPQLVLGLEAFGGDPLPTIQQQHTPGHLNCPACVKALAMMVTPLSASMSFFEASTSFLGCRAILNTRGRVQYIAPRTYRDLQTYLKTLGKFFGGLRLDQIHGGHLASYQLARANGDAAFEYKRGERAVVTCVGAAKINDELAVLKRMLTGAQAWTPQLEATYMTLQEPESEIQRALSPEQQEKLLQTAAAVPDWNVIWWYGMVALHTTFSSDEMRTIRQGEINLTYRILGVNPRYGKNKFRRREIPLTDPGCIWALERLIDRSIELGGRGPEKYLFPRRQVRGRYDGDLPMSETGLRKTFEAVRKAAGVPWFRLNGFRHTAITRMAEAGVPIAIIMERAGHVCPKMTAHYTHISQQAHREAMEQMDWQQTRKPPGSVTSIAAVRMRRSFA